MEDIEKDRDKAIEKERRRVKQLTKRQNQSALNTTSRYCSMHEMIKFLGTLILKSSAKARFEELLSDANNEAKKIGNPEAIVPEMFKAVQFFMVYCLEELSVKPVDFSTVRLDLTCPLCKTEDWGKDTSIDQRAFHFVGKKHWEKLVVKVFRLGYPSLPPRLNNVFLEAHRKDWSHLLLPDKSVNPFSKQNTRVSLQRSNQEADFGQLFRKSELERQNRLRLETDRERLIERNDAEAGGYILTKI